MIIRYRTTKIQTFWYFNLTKQNSFGEYIFRNCREYIYLYDNSLY